MTEPVTSRRGFSFRAQFACWPQTRWWTTISDSCGSVGPIPRKSSSSTPRCARSGAGDWLPLRPYGSVPSPRVCQRGAGCAATEEHHPAARGVIRHLVARASRQPDWRSLLEPLAAVPFPGVIQWVSDQVLTAKQDDNVAGPVVGHGMQLARRWRVGRRELVPSETTLGQYPAQHRRYGNQHTKRGWQARNHDVSQHMAGLRPAPWRCQKWP